VTNNIIGHTETQTVCFLSKTYPGKRHDKRICDDEQYVFPPFAELAQDTGFQGHQPENVIIYQPKKKPKGRELEIDELFINSVISSVRIKVENIICGVKRCRILKDTFRNHVEGFADTAIEIACGLHNLRVRHRQPQQHFDLVALAS